MKALLLYRFNAIIFIFLSIALLSSNANAQTVEPADPSLLELLGVPVEEDEDEYYYEDELGSGTRLVGTTFVGLGVSGDGFSVRSQSPSLQEIL